MSLSLERMTKFAGVTPARGTFPIAANVRIFKGALVGLNSSGQAVPGTTISGGCVAGVGKASATYDNRTGSELGGSAGAVDVEVEFGVFQWENSESSDEIAEDDVGKVCFVVDDQTVSLTNNTDTRGIAGFVTEVRDGKPYVFMGPHVAGLIVIASSEASQLDTAQTDIDALQADVANLQTDAAVGFVNLDLGAWREVSSAGAVGDTTANGGVLASDTTPIFGAEGTTEALAIKWAAGNADIIQIAVSLPPDVNGSAAVTLDLWVLTDNAGGGGIDAASFSVLTSWDNGSQVTDTATDSVPATTVHKITATIDAGDVPATPGFLNIQLVPAAHASDPTHLLAARLNYTRVQT